MIRIIICAALLIVYTKITFAQQVDNTQNDLNNWAKYNSGSRMSTTGAINVFEKRSTKGSRYLIDGWTSGEVVDGKGEAIHNDLYRFNYDKILQQLYLLIDSTVIELDVEKVYSFRLKNPDSSSKKKYFVFKRSELISDTKKNRIFFEQLYKNNEFEILKFADTRFFRADPNDRRPGGTNEPLSNRYEDQNYYYIIFHNNDLRKLKLSRKELNDNFPAKTKQIEEYFNNHRSGNHLNEEEFVELVSSF